MSDWERMQERISVFADADKRVKLTQEELKTCPTLQEVLDAMIEG